MRLSVRHLTLLPLLAALPAGLVAANDVVVLPTLAVADQTPASSGQTSVVATTPGGSASEAFGDLARQTAGLALNDAGARGFGTTTTLRGLGNTPFFSDASAPVYLDDIPLATAFTFPTELYNFAQMTVHRGPQAAAQFGRAGDAGVIQFTSTAPGAKPTARIVASAGDYGAFSATASAQTARSAEFDASASVGTSRRDGYIANTQLQRTVDDRSAVFGRVQLHYRPAKDLELSLHVLAQQSRDGAEALVPLGGPYYTVDREREGATDTDFTAVAVGVTKRLADATVTATTSYTDWNLNPFANRLVVFGGFDLDSVLTQSQRTFNEELRYVSGLFTGGAFFSHSRTEGAVRRSFSGFTIENSRFQLAGDTFALFGQAGFKPDADWLITPGLRLERTAKDFTRTEVVPASRVYRRDDSWNALLPSISATRHVNASTDAVFTVARGFRAGGYSAYTGRADLAGYDPQRTWGVEAALSTADPQTRWAFTARGYAYRVHGYQIERSFAVPNTGTDEYLVVNAGRAQVLGLEIESAWRPMADVTVRAVAGLTDVTLKDFTDPFTGVNYSGNRAPYAPSGNAALRIDYAPARGFFCGAGVTWTGRTFYDEQETAMFSQPVYTLIDAHAGFALGRGDVRLFGRNLGDKAFYSSITPGVGHATPGAPATWGVEVNARW
jgi:outer membrane receptor protein involved in Fe transport